MKDNFSTQSDKYAKFRPTYPKELYDFINSQVEQKDTAWDCGTGNGQVAVELANSFKEVYATDISQSQLDNAHRRSNITYSCQPAEKTTFADSFFDLVIVAQAIHWFDFNRFYEEVNRTLKDDGILVVTGYGLITVDAKVDAVINHFYYQITDPFWDYERKYVDENYETIPFPFHELPAPELTNRYDWTIDHLIGYFETWSAVKHFRKDKGYNPVDLIRDQLIEQWGVDQTKEVSFPVLLRAGRKSII